MELGLEDVLGSYSSQTAPDQAADLSAREEFVQNRSQGNWPVLDTDLIGDNEDEISSYELKRRLLHLNEIRKAASIEFEAFGKPDDDTIPITRDEIMQTIREHNTKLNIESPHHVPTPDHSFFHHQESFQKLMSAGGTKAAFILDDTGTGKSCKILGAVEVALINRVNELGVITGMKTVILCPAELQEKEMRKQLACVCTNGKYEVPIKHLKFKDNADRKSKMLTVVSSVSKSIQRGGRKLWEEEAKIPPSMLPVKFQKHDGITINSFGKFARIIAQDFPQVEHNEALRLLFQGLILVIDELHTRRISAKHFTVNPKTPGLPPLMSMEGIWNPTVLAMMNTTDRLKEAYRDTWQDLPTYKDKVKRYFQIFRIRHLATKARVIGLTATPFVSNLSNMVSQFNLVAPINRQLPYDFFSSENRNYGKYFGNILSYIRAAEVGSKLEVIGDEINKDPSVIAKVGVMSEFQASGYLNAIHNGANVIFLADFLSSLFVFPDGISGNGSGKMTSTAKVEKIDKLKKYDIEDMRVEVPTFNLNNYSNRFSVTSAKVVQSCPVSIFAQESRFNVEYNPRLNGANRYIEEYKAGYFRAKNNEDGRHLQEILADLNKLQNYGVTYANVIDACLSEQGNALVFSRFITGSGSGLLDVALPLYEYEQLCDEPGRTDRMKKKFTRFSGDNSAFSNERDTDVEPFCKMRKKFGSAADTTTNRLAGKFFRAPRYAFITGKTDQNASNILELFNSPENVNGEYIKILIISSIAGVGINIENVRQIHILGGLFTEADEKQAINRCLRVDSYINLLNYIETKYGKEARDNFRVKLFMHCTAYRMSYNPSNPQYNQSVFTKNAEVTIRSKVIGKTLRQEFAKLVAHTYDCQLNYWRNHRKDDRDYSVECAGDKCLMPCADPFVITKPESFIEGEYDGMYRNVEKIFQNVHGGLSYDAQGNWTNVTASFPLNYNTTPAYQYRERNYRTYDIFYSGPEINRISEKIKEYFRSNPNASIDRLSVIINARKKLLLLALTKLITNSEVIIDAYGNPCYLQENNNMFFLVGEYPMRRNVFSGNAALIMNGEKKTNLEDLNEMDYPTLERYVTSALTLLNKIDVNTVINFSRFVAPDEPHQKEFFEVKRNLYRLPANTLVLYLQSAIQNYVNGNVNIVEYFTLLLWRKYLIMIPNFSNMVPMLKETPKEFFFGSNSGKKRTNALKLRNLSIRELDNLLINPFVKFRKQGPWLHVNLSTVFKLSEDMYRIVSAIYKVETDVSVFEDLKWRKLVGDENSLYNMYLQFYVKHLMIRTAQPVAMPYFPNTFPMRTLPANLPLERLQLPYLIVIPVIGKGKPNRIDGNNLAPLVLQELHPANSEFEFGRQITTIGGYKASMLLTRISTPDKQKQTTKRGREASTLNFNTTANLLYYLNWQSSDSLHVSTYYEFWFKLRLLNAPMQFKTYWFNLFCQNVTRWSHYLPFIYEIIDKIQPVQNDMHLALLKCFGVTESEQIAYNDYNDFIVVKAVPDDRLSWSMRKILAERVLTLLPEADRHSYYGTFQESNFFDMFTPPAIMFSRDDESSIPNINSFGVFFATFCSALNNWRSVYTFFEYLLKQMVSDFNRIIDFGMTEPSYSFILYRVCGLMIMNDDYNISDLKSWLHGNFAPEIYTFMQHQLSNLPNLIRNYQVNEKISQILQATSRLNFYSIIRDCFSNLSAYYEILRALNFLMFEDISGYTSMTIHSLTRNMPNTGTLKLNTVRHMFFNPGKLITHQELLRSASDNYGKYGHEGYSGTNDATKYAPDDQQGQFKYWNGQEIPENFIFNSNDQSTYHRMEYVLLEEALLKRGEDVYDQVIFKQTIEEWLEGHSSDLLNRDSNYHKIRAWMQFKRLDLYKDYLRQMNYYGMVLFYYEDVMFHNPNIKTKTPMKVLTKLLLYYLYRDNHFYSFEV